MNRGRTCAIFTLVASTLIAAHLSPSPAEAQVVTRCDQLGSDRSTVTAKRRYGFGRSEVVSFPSDRDGANIQIGLVRPRVARGQRVPVIVQASPYFHALQTVDLRKCAPFLVENYVPQGYAIALIPVRGTGDSGGCFELFGPGERADLDQAVRWLGSRTWSNGSVGMIGKSYDGSTPWMVAAAGNPYLKTIVPVSGVPDVFDLLFGAGTPDFRGPGVLSGAYFTENLLFIDGRAPTRNVETIACPEHAIAEAASVHSFITGEMDPFAYWQARRYTDDIRRRYRGSVFLVQGLQDWNVNPGAQFPLITDLRRRGVPTKMMLGQWGHSYPDEVSPPSEREDFADILLRWFDRWLKGDERSS
ncbi:MAG: CocE/NonD family hydrolase, partial [Actinomycetota bacterium]